MDKNAIYKAEQDKLTKIFQNIDSDKKDLVAGLIKDAAFLFAENQALIEIIEQTGMIKIHPTDITKQKPTEASKQYLKNVAAYATVIKTLKSFLNNSNDDDEDAFDKWVKEKQGIS